MFRVASMNQYQAVNKNLVTFILLIIIASALIVWVFSIAGKINPLIIILFLFDIAFFGGALYEYNKIKKQRIIDLRDFAKARGYKFFERPSEDQIADFKNFQAMEKTLLPPRAHNFLNIFLPKEPLENKPTIVTIRSRIEAGESSSTYYTQVYKFEINKNIPIFFLSGGFNFSFSNLFRSKNIFKGIKDLEEVDIRKFDFPISQYKLYSSDKNIKDFFTKDFIDILNSGLKKKRETVYMESDGKDIIFYIKFKRHSLTGMSFYINLFNALLQSLKLSK